MATWVTDRAGDKLVQQIDVIAPGRSRESDGTIGDLAHQGRDSAHNPEDSEDADAPGNPDNQVDARDVTHDPAHGCDIGVFWEQIRASRDMRARFAIFNRRCFSNYAVTGYPPFTWRPYSGDNPHDKHGHIEIDDRYHDQTHDWKIGQPMYLAACKIGDKGQHVQFMQYGLYDLHADKYGNEPDYKPLYPGNPGSPTLPATFDKRTGDAMKDLLEGGDGVNFTPLLAKRLIRKLGALDAPDPIPGPPGEGVTAVEAKTIAEDVIRHATITPAGG
jgi:hypothetical protein